MATEEAKRLCWQLSAILPLNISNIFCFSYSYTIIMIDLKGI